MANKVGIPRGLFYYKYHPLWKTFFEELGAELIVSERTSRKIFDDGIKSCVDEACLPVKIFYGHVINLKDRVDYIFLPRFTSISRNEYICPKFGGIPDMIRHNIKGLPQIIDTEVNLRKSGRNSLKAALEIGGYFSNNKSEIKGAYKKAIDSYREFRKLVLLGNLPPDTVNSTACDINIKGKKQAGRVSTELNIAVLGHVYNIYDSYTNMDMLKKLRNMNVNIITIEMIDESTINKFCESLNKKMFWNFGRKAFGSAGHLMERNDIDGIIYVMSFGCGIDSFVCDIIERKIRRTSTLPFMVLTIDEHSGEAGINTRLEAFIDMLRWRDKNEINLSAYG
ncbi:MAG: acyl-CoA dehydratase activase-related protein [Acetivibrionales bacterium]